MSQPDFSGPSPIDGNYDIFLSFRGEDTRGGFTTYLRNALRENKIHTFMDDDLVGEEIDHLFRVIAQSRMAVVIYSKNFAQSHWCLQELETILQRKKEQKMMLTPIFYKVNLDELKHITGQTAEYLEEHVAKHGESTVETWKVAVTNFGKVSGLSYKNRDSRSEDDFIKDVIGKIKKKLTRECQQHFVDDQSSKGAKDLVNSQWPSSSSHHQEQQEGMVADKQCFTYGEILKITNNLEKVIARSGLGDVYSGKLNGAAVAVKIPPHSFVQGSVLEQGADVIEKFLRIQSTFRHENLVSLLGYCLEDDEKMALVYEFMENGNLRKHLSGASPRVLNWKERLKIAIDIAEGLKYLHGMPITSSGNLQSTDIVFDEKMTAKILFFPGDRDQPTNPYDRYITSIIVDGAAFLKEKPLFKAEFNKKVDLHCLAMILYELVTGYAPPLTTWQTFRSNLFQGNLKVDSRLGGVYNMMTVQNVVQVAHYCAQMDNMEPPINDVLEALKTQFRITSMTI